LPACYSARKASGTALFSSLVYETNGKLVEYLERQIRALPIEVQLGQEVTPVSLS
jgi:hypothetical protein